ncbi:MAG TPA: hypothetical protein P5262_01820 [Candidatus Moranbacteria bacterium]|nr:hypothetical protein [Candidatus Moranbacteria bacterium]
MTVTSALIADYHPYYPADVKKTVHGDQQMHPHSFQKGVGGNLI